MKRTKYMCWYFCWYVCW